MLTHAALLKFVRPGDCLTSLELRDGKVHIPMYTQRRKIQHVVYRLVHQGHRIDNACALKGNPNYGGRRLQPVVIQQIWDDQVSRNLSRA